MKLVLFCSTQLASFSQFLCCLYYEKATILNLLWFGKRVGGAGNARKATVCLDRF